MENIKNIGLGLNESEVAQMFTSLKTIISGFKQHTKS